MGILTSTSVLEKWHTSNDANEIVEIVNEKNVSEEIHFEITEQAIKIEYGIQGIFICNNKYAEMLLKDQIYYIILIKVLLL